MGEGWCGVGFTVKRVIVAGGGIAGLACAYCLLRLREKRGLDFEVTLLEASNRLGGKVKTDRSEAEGFSLKELLEAVRDAGRSGAVIQRYKGLGEMNPEQLWETTMDPKRRRLLQVTMVDIADAENAFTTLMGDRVEPRRQFIERHAKEVKNLDI